MAIPDFADERAYDRFSRGLVGASHGDNGTAYRTSWDSTCGADPTKMVLTSRRPVCAYCGNAGLPLQPYIKTYAEYAVTGYTCVCKGAMDEGEWRHEMMELENKHEEELRALRKLEPKANPDVIKTLVTTLTERMAKATTLSDVRDLLEQLKSVNEE